jgi:biofilm PGA synthesis N-glycosyltransferase PgaC
VSTVFFLSLAVVIYTYALYPLLIAALARSRARGWQRTPQQSTASIILPVHNGIAMLPTKMESLFSVEADIVQEIIVVCDGCTDGTVEWLSTWHDVRVKTVVLKEQSGKAIALRHGMAEATGEHLVFVDVRPDVTGASIRELLSNFADPTVGCVAGELKIIHSDAGSSTASAVGGLYWRYEQWIRNNEAAVDSPVGVYGGYYAIRRSLATTLPDGLILDDMFQPLSIIRQGYRSVVDADAVVYDRWPATTAGEFNRKVRTLAGNFQLIAMAPWILTSKNRVLFQLVSHKLMRLIVPYCLVVMLLASWILAQHSAFWSVVTIMQVAVWLLAIVSMRVRLPIVGRAGAALSALLVLNAAAIKALWVYLFTRQPLWKIWVATPKPTTHEVAG